MDKTASEWVETRAVWVDEKPTPALQARSHWVCDLIGHNFHVHPTAKLVWCSRCAREEMF